MNINMTKCPLCKNNYINVMNHIMLSKDIKHIEYINLINEILDKYILKSNLLIVEIEISIAAFSPFINRYYISNRIKKIEPNRENRIAMLRNKNDYNKSYRYEMHQTFIEQNKDKWSKEIYKDNLMKILNHYQQSIYTTSNEMYKKYVSNFESVLRCSRCKSMNNIDINFIDNNYSNCLISNIEILCSSCKKLINSESIKRPYITISKTMSFAAAHKLPQYFGNCNNIHGHEWKIEVSIRKRIDPTSMMVMDFKILKTLMKKHIIDILDHNYINDIIVFPTAENLVIWCWEQLMFNGLKGISKIKIWESSDSVAIVTIEDMLSVF